MKKFRVSVSQVVCADVEVEAESRAEAQEKALSEAVLSELNYDDWCEGHRDTRTADAVCEIDENGDEVQ
jgi:hypothetical protein